METGIPDTYTKAKTRSNSNNKFAANSPNVMHQEGIRIIIAEKIQYHLQHNLWPEHPKVFKKGSSTIHNMVTLITDIEIATTKHEKLETIFLNIKKAYDNVDITMLIQSLEEYKLPDNLLIFLYKLLPDRRVT